MFLEKLMINTTILNQEIWVLHNVVRQKFADVSEEVLLSYLTLKQRKCAPSKRR